MTLKLHNSLSGKKEIFTPIDAENVRMYVCGPTVYDRPHIGNARAVVVYDVLYRLLTDKFHEENVTYVRNITDVDDKINKAAKQNDESIKNLSERIIGYFHEDMHALGNLKPNHEPKATENIAEIIEFIQKILDNNHAYIADGHVLFDVKSLKSVKDYNYGSLSGKKLEDLIAGARVEVESYKKNAEDFVLWKPASAEDDISSKFNSPFGEGRPGWHIECSAMSTKYLGENFDIHGGGADLKFPHHENELAQTKSANHHATYAKYWVHNGFLTVNGEKMSKSLGNFTTVKELLDKGIKGEVIRFALISSHYSKPLDFSDKLLDDSQKSVDKFYSAIKTYHQNLQDNLLDHKNQDVVKSIEARSQQAYDELTKALSDDINTPLAISHLYTIAKGLRSLNCTEKTYNFFNQACKLLGLCQTNFAEYFASDADNEIDEQYILNKIEARAQAKQNKDYALADQIRDELKGQGITIKDTASGTDWSYE